MEHPIRRADREGDLRIIVVGTRRLPADTTAEAIQRYAGLSPSPETFTTAELTVPAVRQRVAAATVLVFATTDRLDRRPCGEISFEKPPALVIVDHAGYVTPEQAALLQAEGYVGAGASAQTVGERVARVAQGGRAFPARTTDRLQKAARFLQGTYGGISGLRDVDRAILRLAALDRIVKEIARELKLTEHQVNAHLRHIRRILNVRTTQAALARATEAGVISLDETDSSLVESDDLLIVEDEERGILGWGAS
jgi:DNA-binding NarL/FixJ family response regulator